MSAAADFARVREIAPGDTDCALAALLELRPEAGPLEALRGRVEEQRANGYRLAGSFEEGDPVAAAVAGFRYGSSLAWGRYLYVEDLVTRAALRGRGHATDLMAWVEEEARSEGCDQLHLDSGVGASRVDAHRLYMQRRLTITSHHFARRLI